MKKMIITMVILTGFLGANERFLRSEFKKMSGKNSVSCEYIGGSFNLVRGDREHVTNNGYLICYKDSGLITVFERIVEEEGKKTVLVAGDIMIEKR